jgi:hypothetical protein
MQELTSNDLATTVAKRLGIHTWNHLLEYIQALPYGRNANRHDFHLVLEEEQGTCSSKHALLKHIALHNHIPDVELIIGIYKMSQVNTPQLGSMLDDIPVEYIPEAHCYLNIRGTRVDVTFPTSDIADIESDIICEKVIEPDDVVEYKITYHQDFLRQWMQEEQVSMSFEELWQFREMCIQKMTTTDDRV